MGITFRTSLIGTVLGVVAAGVAAAPALFPQAFADEPQSHLLDTAKDLFPAPFDMKRLRHFDIAIDDSVSTTPDKVTVIKKYGFGQKTIVSIIKTPTGTYSSDALVSPNVRYPGIEVTPKHRHGGWSFSSLTTPYGTGTWTNLSSGSFTWYHYSFTPAARSRT